MNHPNRGGEAVGEEEPKAGEEIKESTFGMVMDGGHERCSSRYVL